MSRHRNIRSMNYSEECEGYDDVYGHSVEDDYCISPSEATFMYDREGKNRSMGSFLGADSSIAEGEEPPGEEAAQGDLTDAKLASCVDKIKETIGDTVSREKIVESIVKHDYDSEKALDDVLRNSIPEKSIFKTPGSKGSTIEAGIKTIKIIPHNITKGFELTTPDKEIRVVNSTLTPRSQSPASGRVTPLEGRATPDIQRLKESKIDPLELYKKERTLGKQNLYMIIIGHVDAGKSTLMGHLLCAMGEINQRIMHKNEVESRKIGKQSFAYAWVLDETGEERERGITMDIGKSVFETKTKKVTLLDAPGHRDFIPNMITGAVQADVALMVVDATRGEFETGFDLGGQTREHALLARALGIGQIAVVINKLDNVKWVKSRFDEIRTSLSVFLKQVGFRDKDVSYIPCSGLTGQNLIGKPTENLLTQWYDGPCLLDVIDAFVVPERSVQKPFRFSIHDVFKGTGIGLCVSGRVDTGMVSPADRILVCPVREVATVRSISLDDVPITSAFAGDQVTITLTGLDIQNLTVGCILSSSTNSIPVVQKFEAKIVVFNIKQPLTRGYPVLLHHQSLVEGANISKIKAIINKTNGKVQKKNPRCLTSLTSAIVDITVNKPVCVELFKDVKELGRIMLRVGGVTVAAGLVTELYHET